MKAAKLAIIVKVSREKVILCHLPGVFQIKDSNLRAKKGCFKEASAMQLRSC